MTVMDYTKFEVDYSSAGSCLVFIREELAPYPTVTVGSDTLAQLDLESGTDPQGVRVHRPYARMAALLARAKNEAHMNKGKGGFELRHANETIREWRAEQQRIDAALSLTVPPTGERRNRGTTFSRIVPSF